MKTSIEQLDDMLNDLQYKVDLILSNQHKFVELIRMLLPQYRSCFQAKFFL